MKRLFICLMVAGIFLCTFSSALTQVSVYVDSTGRAQILGVTDEQPLLPEGISLQEGRIEGYTETITSKEGALWHLSYRIASSEALIVLPSGATIQSLSHGEISTYQGRISVYVQNNSDIEYTLSSSSPDVTKIVLAIAVILIAGGSYWYYKSVPKKKHRPVQRTRRKSLAPHDKIDIVSSILNEREREIINVLQRIGKQKMSVIRRQTTIPKASFSRHIHELVKKNLVTLSGEGKNKFVNLHPR